jgi:hypothetical protein
MDRTPAAAMPTATETIHSRRADSSIVTDWSCSAGSDHAMRLREGLTLKPAEGGGDDVKNRTVARGRLTHPPNGGIL